MPPHCDAMDGPVVREARRALEIGKVEAVLPYAPETAEAEIRKAFDLAATARTQGEEAKEASDLYFLETVVRLHRAGEGAPYTGLKPAGLDHGPVLPLAEKALETGSADELLHLLTDAMSTAVKERLDHVLALKASAGGGLTDARSYASAMLGFQVYSNNLFKSMHADPHASHGSYERHSGDPAVSH